MRIIRFDYLCLCTALSYVRHNNWRRGGMSISDDAHGGATAPAPPAAAAPGPCFRTMGSLHEFRPESEDFSTYMERVDIFFSANDVREDKKVPVFLNAVGGNTYGVLRSLLAPDSPMSRSMAEIVAKLREHFEPAPSVIAERFKFHKRNQAAGESIATYIAELRRLAARCSFPRDYLDETLRDRFVCGLNSESFQKRLLAEKDLTMQTALEKAQNLETAQKNAQVLKGQAPALSVGQISGRGSKSQTSRGQAPNTQESQKSMCHRCGIKGHKGRDCRHLTTVCHKCGKVGHLAKVCRSSGQGRGAKSKTASVGAIDPDKDGIDNDLLCKIYTLRALSQKPYSEVLKIEGQPVTFIIDTGAAVSIIPARLRTQLFSDVQLEETDIRLRSYTANTILVLGSCLLQSNTRGTRADMFSMLLKAVVLHC